MIDPDRQSPAKRSGTPGPKAPIAVAVPMAFEGPSWNRTLNYALLSFLLMLSALVLSYKAFA